jgi:predicted DNA-binding transcriptional regulator AlpA
MQALLSSKEAAAALGLRSQTLVAWRSQRRAGPPYLRVGNRSIRYRLEDIQMYLEGRIVRPVDPGAEVTA